MNELFCEHIFMIEDMLYIFFPNKSNSFPQGSDSRGVLRSSFKLVREHFGLKQNFAVAAACRLAHGARIVYRSPD